MENSWVLQFELCGRFGGLGLNIEVSWQRSYSSHRLVVMNEIPGAIVERTTTDTCKIANGAFLVQITEFVIRLSDVGVRMILEVLHSPANPLSPMKLLVMVADESKGQAYIPPSQFSRM